MQSSSVCREIRLDLSFTAHPQTFYTLQTTLSPHGFFRGQLFRQTLQKFFHDTPSLVILVRDFSGSNLAQSFRPSFDTVV